MNPLGSVAVGPAGQHRPKNHRVMKTRHRMAPGWAKIGSPTLILNSKELTNTMCTVTVHLRINAFRLRDDIISVNGSTSICCKIVW